MSISISSRFFERLGDQFVIYSLLAKSGEVISLSTGFEKIFGLPVNTVINRHWAEVIQWLPTTREYVDYENELLMQGKQNFTNLELQFYHPDGRLKTVKASQYIAKDESSNIVIEGIAEDITRRAELENTLQQMALFDSLTRVFNRKAIEHAIESEFKRSIRHGHQASVLLLDLDYFKRINDKYGHAAGDQALEKFATTLTETVRASDSVGRYGGEEFIVLLPETTISEAMKLAERIRKNTAELLIDFNGQLITFTTSIGVAAFPVHAKSWEKFYLKIDQALYDAKHAGRNCVKVAEKATQ